MVAGSFDMPGDTYGVFVAGGFVYVVDHFSLTVLRLPQALEVPEAEILPVSFSLGQNYPNPFNPATIIRYAVATRSQVTIEVINMLGQRVRMLVNDTKPAGSYQVEWDGRDDSGRQVSSGVYLYRFQADDVVLAKKMVLIK
jgi:hypothetical protein